MPYELEGMYGAPIDYLYNLISGGYMTSNCITQSFICILHHINQELDYFDHYEQTQTHFFCKYIMFNYDNTFKMDEMSS